MRRSSPADAGPGADTPTRARRPAGAGPVVALVLAVALLAASCGSSTDALGGHVVRHGLGADGSGDRAAAGTAEPAPTYRSWRTASCPFPAAAAHGLTVECGELVVPMDRSDPGSAPVTLAVARVRSSAATPRPDPVVYLEGGPGGSALSSIDFWTDPPAPFLAQRDLILVDQRGTGYSTPRLTCEELTDDTYGAAVVRVTEDCVRLLHNDGVDLSAFDTTESAADLHDLRRALGVAEWNLFGISYGTRLALWTAHTRPHGIRSLVLDSVYPPGVTLADGVARSFLRAVRAIAADCAGQPACAAAHPDLEGEVATAIERAEATAPGLGAEFARFLFQSLYATSVAPVVPRAVGLAAAGRTAEAVAVLRGARSGLAEDASPGITTRPHMSEALYQSVECAETAPATSTGAIRAAARDLPPVLAQPFVEVDLRLMAVCNVWKVDANLLEPVPSDVPALVLAGSYDPVTPPAWAEQAVSTLPRARYQLVQGAAHGVWLAGDCPRHLVSAFLDDPTGAAGPLPACPGAAPAFAP